MEIQYKAEAGAAADIDLEYEYDIEFKIESLTLKQHQPSDIIVNLLFGERLLKLSCEKDESFEGKSINFAVHYVPSALAQKLLDIEIVLYCVSKEPDSKLIGD